MISRKLVMIILSALSLLLGCATNPSQMDDIPPEGIHQDQAAPYLDIGSTDQGVPPGQIEGINIMGLNLKEHKILAASKIKPE